MHWLTLQFRDPAHEQTYRQHAVARFVWLDFLLGLIALGIYTAWAATDYARWRAAVAASLSSWPAAQQLLDLHTPAQQSNAAGILQDVCAASEDQQLTNIQSSLLTGVAISILICGGTCLLKCWLILFNRRWFLQNFNAFGSVDWWSSKVLSLGAGIAYCTLSMPGMTCGMVLWLAAYLAVTTSLRLSFQRSLVYSVVYSILWSAVRYTPPLSASRNVGARQQLSITVFVLGLQYVVETCARLFYARVVASAAAGTLDSTPTAEVADPESDCDDDPPTADSAEPMMINSSKSLLEQQQQRYMREEYAEEQPPHSSNPGDHRRSSRAASTAAAVAVAAAAVASSGAAEAAGAESPTIMVAALPSVGEMGHEGHGRGPSGASLVYESPLLHRTIGVKVYSTSGLSRELAATRLATSVQAALHDLPQGARLVDGTEQVARSNPSGAGPSTSTAQMVPHSDAVMVSRVLVPGCVMLLGTVVMQQQQERQQQQQQAGQQQRSTAARYFSEGVWHLHLSAACCSYSNDSSLLPAVPFKYGTIQELEAAITDGMFVANMQACLDGTAAAAPDCEDMYLPQEQYVVSSYGCNLHMVSQGSGQGSAVPEAAKLGRSCPGSVLPVRLVLTKGNTVMVDQHLELQQVTTGYQTRARTSSCSNKWQLQVQLPSRVAIGGRSLDHPAVGCVLTLRLLSPQLSDSDSNGTMDSNSSDSASTAESGQYASITALLLPHAAAAEAQAWLQQTRMSQKCLQPLLRDMAVALQAAGMAAATGRDPAAVTADWLDGAATAADRAVLTAAIAASAGDALHALQLPHSYWATAAETAGRAQKYLAAQGLSSCSSVMGNCVQQVSQMCAQKGPSPAVLAAAEKRAAATVTAAVDAAVYHMTAQGA